MRLNVSIADPRLHITWRMKTINMGNRKDHTLSITGSDKV